MTLVGAQRHVQGVTVASKPKVSLRLTPNTSLGASVRSAVLRNLSIVIGTHPRGDNNYLERKSITIFAS